MWLAVASLNSKNQHDTKKIKRQCNQFEIEKLIKIVETSQRVFFIHFYQRCAGFSTQFI